MSEQRASGVIADPDDVYTDLDRVLRMEVGRRLPESWKAEDIHWAAHIAVEALSANGYYVIDGDAGHLLGEARPCPPFVPRRVYVFIGPRSAAEQVRLAHGLSPDEVVVANSKGALRGMAFCVAEVLTHEHAASALGPSTVEAIMQDVAIIRSTHNRAACPHCADADAGEPA